MSVCIWDFPSWTYLSAVLNNDFVECYVEIKVLHKYTHTQQQSYSYISREILAILKLYSRYVSGNGVLTSKFYKSKYSVFENSEFPKLR